MSCGYVTRNVFLKCMSGIYLAAFVSLYTQVPGLYGRNGVLPAYSVLHSHDPSSSPRADSSPGDWQRLFQLFLERPTLLWLRHLVGLDTQHAMEALALTGTLLSLLALLFEVCRTSLVFLVLLVAYSSFFQVGQVFMSFQWDTLLLETGLLCVLAAPLFPWRRGGRGKTSSSRRRAGYHDAWDTLAMWLVRWLLFRLMFASGIVKLQSHCPTWWGLSALQVHFESQCIPTPLAWYAHHLPVWLLRLSTAFAIYLESFLPFLFFVPIRQLRISAFYMQVFLQVMIILTGNYNFFNLLTIALCFSLLDDEFLRGKRIVYGLFRRICTSLVSTIVYAALIYLAVVLFSLKVEPQSSQVVTSRVAFGQSQFSTYVSSAVPVSVIVAAASLATTMFETFLSTVSYGGGCCRKLYSLFHWFLAAITTCAIFSLTLAPHTKLDPETYRHLPSPLRSVHLDTPLAQYSLFNSYGLFRRMTGTEGRPEVILEGADSVKGPWTEIQFLYKPGDVYRSPPFVFPHQPRLDWQMWFAALGSEGDNPWLQSLAYRVLTGQPDVLRLLKGVDKQFAAGRPKFMRAVRYIYRYTPWIGHKGAWWTRGAREEYMSITSADNKRMLDNLKQNRILMGLERASSNVNAARVLEWVWVRLGQWPTEILIWSILAAVLLITRSRVVSIDH